MVDARHVRFARELEERDAAVAAALEEVRALQADVEELRAHAVAAAGFRERYPDDSRRLAAVHEEALDELQARERELAAAEAELARAKDGEQQAAARRAVTRAGDAAASARRRAARLEGDRAELEREAERTERDLPRLDARAAELARRLAAAPRTSSSAAPADGLEETLRWTTQARSSLFVAGANLENERDALVREANELLAATFDEPAAATSVPLATARIERAAAAGTMPPAPS